MHAAVVMMMMILRARVGMDTWSNFFRGQVFMTEQISFDNLLQINVALFSQNG